ncbi:porin [Paraneptunicella aestuarii]|uniref:porin n=1 Tax=Paraneptunicella aestuarii TaxID=2831148 RepID=UPI001E2BEEB0|nr:porin [Paraneptunicella aestuarii]UAA38985.1 porin [Paraneptunicella aestuarii]
MNKYALAVVPMALLFTGAAHAEAKVTAYGRVLYNMISDDTSDNIYFGRHEFAESNIGLKGSVDYDGLTIGAQLEIGLNEGVSNLLQNGSNGRNRIQEITVAGTFGKVRLGTGESTTYIISDVDQSGTWLSDPLGMSSRFGSTRRGPSGESQTPLVQSQSIFNERILYESPKVFGGGQFSGQLGEDNSYEVAFKYLQDGWRFNVWHADFGDGDNDSDPQANIDGNPTPGFFGAENGSGVLLGYKHDSGVNLTAVYGTADLLDGGSRDYLNWKLGYSMDKHAVSISMGTFDSEDAMGVDGAEHQRTTLAYHFIPLGGVRFWLQATTGDTDDQESFNAFAAGGMVKF